MAKPQYIDMDWDIMSGKEFARTLEYDDEDKDDEYYYEDDDYNSNSKHNVDNNNYGNSYRNNYNSQHDGIVAKLGSTCRTCKRAITAGKDRIKRNNYGNWVHVRCASRKY